MSLLTTLNVNYNFLVVLSLTEIDLSYNQPHVNRHRLIAKALITREIFRTQYCDKKIF